MSIMKDRKIYWIFGTIIALAGVTVVRLIAPELAGVLNKIVLISGYVLSLAGIIVLARSAKA